MMKHLLFMLLIVSVGCTSGDADRQATATEAASAAIPDSVIELENLKVIEVDEEELDTVVLVREQVFESGEEVYIGESLGGAVVDSRNRVYLSTFSMGDIGVYVFEPDGRYVTKFGQRGKGPGEFQIISDMVIKDGEIFIFDSRLQKISVFSLDDYSLIREELLKRGDVKSTDTLAYIFGGSDIHNTASDTLLLRLQSRSMDHTPESYDREILYYRISSDGEMIPGRILELKRHPFYFRESRAGRPEPLPVPMPFSPGSIVAVSDQGTIYSAWGDDFLISVHNSEGNFQQAIYYPYPKSNLNIPELNLREMYMEGIEDNRDRVPDFWPALNTMEVDDENRLWISTITDSDSTFQWWVIDSGGELLARFTMPGERESRRIMGKPFYLIRNGYFYYRENEYPEVDRIVKSRIEFRER